MIFDYDDDGWRTVKQNMHLMNENEKTFVVLRQVLVKIFTYADGVLLLNVAITDSLLTA